MTDIQPNITNQLTQYLVRLTTLRDPLISEHSERVGNLTLRLAARVSFPADRLETLYQGAYLHDIGKVAVPDTILNKMTQLSPEEYTVIQQHTLMGYRIIETLRLDRMIGNAVLLHHENFDGSGYPNGLKGQRIPLEARIIRITDFYDALVSPRSYRDAYAPHQAIRILEENHHCFDPHLFRVFLRMMQ